MVWDRKLMQKKAKWPCTIQERSGKDDIPILQSHYIAIFSSIQLKRKLLRTPLCWATFSISYWSQTKHLLLLHADLGNHRGSNCSNPGQWGGVVHVWSSHAILTCCWWLLHACVAFHVFFLNKALCSGGLGVKQLVCWDLAIFAYKSWQMSGVQKLPSGPCIHILKGTYLQPPQCHSLWLPFLDAEEKSGETMSFWMEL